MITYIDSSILLRLIFREKNDLKEWPKLKCRVSSRLLKLECLRSIDRFRLLKPNEHDLYLEYIDQFFKSLKFIGLIPLNNEVITQAEKLQNLSLGSLDSIHLASALLWSEQNKEKIMFATHDKQLNLAAKLQGFEVIGIE